MEQLLEQFGKIPAQQKWLGLAGAIAILAALTYFLFVSDLTDKIERNTATIDKQTAELQKLEAQAQNLTQYKREVKKLEQKLKEAETMLPKKAEVSKLLQDIDYEAKQSGLEVQRFELKDEQKDGDFARVPVNMKVKGSYHEIAVFLDRIAKMSRIVNVTDVAMKQPRTESKRVVLTSQFDATTYRFLETSEAEKKKKKKKNKKKNKKK